jgi:hypothetical protein
MFGKSALVLGQTSVSSDASCWRDYPIPTNSVNYEKAFASETLAPDRISVNQKVLRLGATENYLNSVLGATSIVVEDWKQRTEQEQCEYLLELLRNHPSSMHLYQLKKVQLERLSGMFSVSEWQIRGIGKLRAFFHKSSTAGVEASYLYYLTMFPTSPRNIERSRGPSYVLTRDGVPIVKWDVRTNGISILAQSNGR